MKLLPLFLAVLCLMVSASCREGKNKDERPDRVLISRDSVIPEKKMVSLLTDMHILEAGIQIRRNRGETDNSWNADAYRKLFFRYQVTKSQFERNLEWYQQDPKVFTKIYDSVLQTLDRLRNPKPQKSVLRKRGSNVD
jgi:hypothetical protein